MKYVSSGDFWPVKSKFDQNVSKYFRSGIKIISKEGINNIRLEIKIVPKDKSGVSRLCASPGARRNGQTVTASH